MEHISETTLLNLAQLSLEGTPFSPDENTAFEHIKSCEECYSKFSAALILAEMETSEGRNFLSGIFKEKKENAVLAILKVVRAKADNAVSAVFEQLNALEASLQFQQPLLVGARGFTAGRNRLLKLEDRDDERTYAVYDPVRGEMMIQIHSPEVSVKLIFSFSDGSVMEIPTEKKGDVFLAVVSGLPDMDFEIHLEKSDIQK